MALLELCSVTKSFNSTDVLSNVSLSVQKSEIVCILGPSGCGKTTLLRLIAGLEDPDKGTVIFQGQVINKVAPKNRGFGLMFQDLALFPHMTVFGNVSFGLRMQRLSKNTIDQKVDHLLDLLNLSGYRDRRIAELSGGEKQRVALARSLAPEPELLMLDEPLVSLDRELRESIQNELRTTLKNIGMTSIYVTHDRDEAYALADSIIVMNEGAIVQTGSPEALFTYPASEVVAKSLGIVNVFKGSTICKNEYLEIKCPFGTLSTLRGKYKPSERERSVLLVIDEDKLSVQHAVKNSGSAANTFEGTVETHRFHAGDTVLAIRIGETLIMHTFKAHSHSHDFETGEKISITIPAEAVRIIN